MTDLTMGLGWPSGGEQPRMTLSPVLALVRLGSPGNSCCRSEIFIDNISHLISLSWLIIHFISKIPSIVQFQGDLRAQFKFCKSYGSLWSKKEQNSWQIQFLILSPRLFNVWESIQYACLRALLEQCSFLHLSEDALRALLSSVHLFESLQCLWPF